MKGLSLQLSQLGGRFHLLIHKIGHDLRLST